MEHHEYFGNYGDNVVLCEFCEEYVLLPCESSEEAENCEMSED